MFWFDVVSFKMYVCYFKTLYLQPACYPSVEKYVLFDASCCRDAAALAQFWDWLEEEIQKDTVLTEVEVSDKLLEFRSKQAGFVGTSFDTISGN